MAVSSDEIPVEFAGEHMARTIVGKIAGHIEGGQKRHHTQLFKRSQRAT